MKTIDIILIAAIILTVLPVIFSIFFLAIRAILKYIIPAIRNKQNHKRMQKELNQLIAQTKGKFFSVTFEKKDGTLRIINGKDKYLRLLSGGENKVAQAGYVSAVNRNKENWFAMHPLKVKEFRCGSIVKTF